MLSGHAQLRSFSCRLLRDVTRLWSSGGVEPSTHTYTLQPDKVKWEVADARVRVEASWDCASTAESGSGIELKPADFANVVRIQIQNTKPAAALRAEAMHADLVDQATIGSWEGAILEHSRMNLAPLRVPGLHPGPIRDRHNGACSGQ